jgi:hypothetical protein
LLLALKTDIISEINITVIALNSCQFLIGEGSMINIYTDMNSIPIEKEYVEDNEAFFVRTEIKDSKINRLIINEIDEGEYLASDRFIDRLGVAVFIRNLSMSSKTLLNLANYKDKVFNGIEMGENAFELMLYCIPECNVYFNKKLLYEIPDDVDMSNVSINGRLANCMEA